MFGLYSVHDESWRFVKKKPIIIIRSGIIERTLERRGNVDIPNSCLNVSGQLTLRLAYSLTSKFETNSTKGGS